MKKKKNDRNKYIGQEDDPDHIAEEQSIGDRGPRNKNQFQGSDPDGPIILKDQKYKKKSRKLGASISMIEEEASHLNFSN